MTDTIQRLDDVALHLLTEHSTLARVIRHCKERQEEIRERLKQVEELLAKERDLRADQPSVDIQTYTGQSDSQKTHAIAFSD